LYQAPIFDGSASEACNLADTAGVCLGVRIQMFIGVYIFPVIFVMIWAYLNYYEPLALPMGLLILVAYMTLSKHHLFCHDTHRDIDGL
jgi:hypothetical protein